MGDDIGSGSIYFCFSLNLRSAAHWLPNKLRQLSVTEPKPMSSPSLIWPISDADILQKNLFACWSLFVDERLLLKFSDLYAVHSA